MGVASTNESLYLNGSAAATVKQNAHKVSGRDWKAPKQPVRKQRTQLTSYEERRRQDAERQAVAKVEKEMKAEKAAEKQRHADHLKERRAKAEEKARMAAAAEKMSKKRLQRLKKKLGRSKKVNA